MNNKDEKRVNLEGVLYSGNEFMPLTGGKGNTNGELAHLRNTYMEAERDYFEYLLTDEILRDSFLELIERDSEDLFKRATELQEQLETGELESAEEREMMEQMTPEERDAFHMQKLEQAEGLMCLLFAAARDRVKTLDLVYTPQPEGKTR